LLIIIDPALVQSCNEGDDEKMVLTYKFGLIDAQASPDAELLNNSLHSDLQSVITNF